MAIAVRDVCSVFKLRIGVAIAASALAGVAVTQGPFPAWRAGLLAAGVLGASAAAGAFNQYVERDLDARMARTRARPFVRGAFTARPGWLWGLALLLAASVASAALAGGTLSAIAVLFGALVYGVVYTVWLKRRTALNIVIGGLSGSFAVLAGAMAVDASLQAPPLLLALVLFLWTPPHFWSLAAALKDDYARAGVPMLPNVVGERNAAWIILGHTVLLVLLSLIPAALGLGIVYAAAAAIGGALFVWRSIGLVRNPGPRAAMANFHASLIQLCLLLIGATADGWLAVAP
jgi:protoheme IX farnesyltransferase